MTTKADYDDEYATCEDTFATLRIFQRDLDPTAVSERLGLQPTESFARTMTRPGYRRKQGAWLLTSENRVESKDVRRHVDWILAQLAGKSEVLREMQASGYEIDIFCYWVSKSGHGGPMLSPDTMQRLADANLSIGFDVYFYDGEDVEHDGTDEQAQGVLN